MGFVDRVVQMARECVLQRPGKPLGGVVTVLPGFILDHAATSPNACFANAFVFPNCLPE